MFFHEPLRVSSMHRIRNLTDEHSHAASMSPSTSGPRPELDPIEVTSQTLGDAKSDPFVVGNPIH